VAIEPSAPAPRPAPSEASTPASEQPADAGADGLLRTRALRSGRAPAGRRDQLGAGQLGVQAPGASSSSVGAALDDLAGVEHDDEVGVDDRRQPVGDHQRRPALQRLLQRRLHQPLGLGVEVGGRLVEDHDRRVLEQHAGDRQPLLLAAGQPVAALADDGVVAVGQPAITSWIRAARQAARRAPRRWRRVRA
jgi:hypothetical protein